MSMKLDSIIIPSTFQEKRPAKYKMDECRYYYEEHGKLDREIVVDHEGVLIDGYVGYLVLQEHNVMEADVKVANRIAYQKSRNYHNTETMYVYGRHAGKQAEYVWRMTPQTKNAEYLHVGCRAMVRTRFGIKVVEVTNVRMLKEPPVKGAVKKVIKCLTE